MTTEFHIAVGGDTLVLAHPWITDVELVPTLDYLKITITIPVPLGVMSVNSITVAEPATWSMSSSQEVLAPSYNKNQLIADDYKVFHGMIEIAMSSNLSVKYLEQVIEFKMQKILFDVYQGLKQTSSKNAKVIKNVPPKPFATGGYISKKDSEKFFNADYLADAFPPGSMTVPKIPGDHSALARHIKDLLPGVDVKVECPEKKCIDGYMAERYEDSIWGMVMHLNDTHKITREKIADWLDELHDNGVVNLEINSPDQDKA